MEEDEEMNQEVLSLFTLRGNRLPAAAAAAVNAAATSPVTTTAAAAAAAAAGQSKPSDWQASYGSVTERNAVIFNSETLADVHFVVGAPPHVRRVPAHKLVLAVGSSVFEAMFFGGLAGAAADDIEIPDVDPEAFLNLLRYLYCDSVELEMDSVMATLYAAKKYIVPHLVCECVRLLETRLSAANACQLLSQCRLFDEAGLTRRCWQVVDAQTVAALAAPGFSEVDATTLVAVLGRDSLNAAEPAVFEAALRWAAAECARRGRPATPAGQRAALGDALYLLRLPAMSVREFADGPAQSGVLTLQETHDVFLHLSAARRPPVPFPCGARRGLPLAHCRRFLSAAYRSNQWRYRGRCDSIQFAVDRCVFLAGLRLYGSSNGAADYRAAVEVKRDADVAARVAAGYHADGSSDTFPVLLDTPLQLLPDVWYTASVVVAGDQLTYFGQEGQTDVVADGDVHFQFQCSSDSTNGTGVQGGQIPELLYYC